MTHLQNTYPLDLMNIRAGVISHRQTTATEQLRLLACRFHSGCGLTICPSCRRKAGFRRSQQLRHKAELIPANRQRFGTFTSLDVPLESLRGSAKALMIAGRATLRKLKIASFALRLEASPVDWSEDYHPHLHLVADVPATGRGYVSAESWQNEWLTALPADLHPTVGGSLVSTVEDMDAVAAYVTKSPFAVLADADEASIHRVLNSMFEVKGRGLQTFNLRGSFAA